MVNNETCGDLKISGSGKATGGRYRQVAISGSGKIVGDIQCESFKISGSGKVEGAITTNEFRISGSGKVTQDLKCIDGGISGSGTVQGSVYANRFKISGSGKVGGNFKGENFTISGGGTVRGRISSTNVDIHGGVRVEQGIEGEIININGSIITQGMVNGDEVNIGLNGSCEIEEIGASRVRVSEELNIRNSIALQWLIKLFSRNHGYLRVKTIEADEVYLENTIAEVVRGEKIIIGKGCNIKRIEYRNSFEKIDSNSIVEEERRL